MEEIYIALVDTPGLFAWLIRTFLRQRYVHVVLAADPRLEEAYSIGRRNPSVPVIAGFEKEDREKILRVFPDAYYRVCALHCTEEQKSHLIEQVRNDYRRRFRIHYAVCSLPFLLVGIPFYIKDQYTCSSYLARILQEHEIVISEKHFSLVTPKDFLEYPGMRVIFEGRLQELAEEQEVTGRESAYAYDV